VAAGWYHSLAVTMAGEVLAWGFNTPDRTPPGFRSVSIPTLVICSAIRSVAAGGVHSLALTTGGRVLAWGGNDQGQLGNGTKERCTVPLEISGIDPNVISVAAGSYHSLAVTEDYEILFWGSGMTGPRLLPAKIHMEDGMYAVAGGGVHSLAASLDGALFSWGGNTCGQLGDGSIIDRETASQPVLGPTTIEIKARKEQKAALIAGPAEITDNPADLAHGAHAHQLAEEEESGGNSPVPAAREGGTSVPSLLLKISGVTDQSWLAHPARLSDAV